MLNPKSEILNSKQIPMSQIPNSKQYDLEKRTLEFSKKIIKYISGMAKTLVNIEIGKQLIRAAGSIGANYIEANEALSRKDFLMRIKISKKEAKETRYWLNLIDPSIEYSNDKTLLIQEVTELMKIFGAIIEKSI